MKNSLETTQSNEPPRIVGLSHAGIRVSNMSKALVFYSDFLGLEEQYQLLKDDGALALKFLKINDRQCIELFPEKSEKEDRLYQIAFIVEDIEAMRLHLAAHGIPVPATYTKGRIGNLSFSVKDPDEHILEFVQYAPDGWTLHDTGKHLKQDRISVRLKHIGFTVRSLDASLKFYRDILGCIETWRGSPNETALSWVNMKLPDSDDYLELMLYKGELSKERLGSLNHLSLEVRSVPAATAILGERAESGCYNLPISHKIGTNRKRLANFFDPDGTRTEIMEPITIDGMSPPFSKAPPPED